MKTLTWKEWYARAKGRITDKKKFRLMVSRRKYRVAHRKEMWLAELRRRKRFPEQWKAQLDRNRRANIQLCAKKKDIILDHYGRKCACCGFTDVRFLTIDHVLYGKHNHMSAVEARRCGINVYRQIIREGFPSSFQILCISCNWAKGVFGECFHVKDKEAFNVKGHTVS